MSRLNHNDQPIYKNKLFYLKKKILVRLNIKLGYGKGTITTTVVEVVDYWWDIVGQPKHC